MLCILAVFIPAFVMQGAAQRLFTPLALAVGFAMIGSYLLSSTFVPVISVWLLRHFHVDPHEDDSLLGRLRRRYEQALSRLVKWRWSIVGAYVLVAGVIIGGLGPWLGREIFPVVDAGQFRLRIRAPDGTQIARTERYALDVLDLVEAEVGAENVALTLGYVGMIHSNFPVNAVYQWSRGPEEAILYVELNEEGSVDVEQLKETLRARVAESMPELRVSFEPSDIVNEVMSFGSPTPIDIAVSGPNLSDSREFAEKLRGELSEIPSLRDVQFGQSMDYPTIEIEVDREKAGLAGLTPVDVSRALTMATSSSRFVVPNYWADPKSGIAYQVQVEVPRPVLRSPDDRVLTVQSAEDLARLPVGNSKGEQVLVRDVSSIKTGSMPGQFDRYNMRRQVTIAANIYDEDLGQVAEEVQAAIRRAGEPPQGAKVEVRGQIVPMQEMMSGLTAGFGMAILVVFLVLTANFQSVRLGLAAISTVPAVMAGVILMLILTGTTLNTQSFIGAIMAIGVAMANAILLITFAESARRQGRSSSDAAVFGAASRMRAVLMTSCAMIAGMLPMALGLGEAGQQNAPLGRAVIGGLLAATATTLLILPSVFAIIQSRAKSKSASLDPTDPHSAFFTSTAAGTLAGSENQL
jgi:multidrug efflux pump subunit AcrB